MSNTPQSERLHIALFGRCNSGKSSLLNLLTGQQAAIVSPRAGTTTDPVRKAMEWPGLGAVTLIDTPGLDDQSALGAERMAQSRKILDATDRALLLLSSEDLDIEQALLEELRLREIPTLVLLNQIDLLEDPLARVKSLEVRLGQPVLPISARTGEGLEALHRAVATLAPREEQLLTEGLCEAGDVVLLIMPQDASAPKGRLIQPQVQTLRELLDRHCIALCCPPEEMASTLAALKEPPRLIITDSQVFDRVEALTPASSLLTSFSVLMARYKGDIREFVAGAEALKHLTAQSRVLIAEACTHAPQNEDIGRVKLPRMLRKRFGEELQIDIVGGRDFPEDLGPYDLVIHCGACMFNRRLVMSRVARARAAGVPITNYGVVIAALQGILDRVKW